MRKRVSSASSLPELLLAACLSTALAGTATAADGPVVVVTGSDNAYYRQTIASLRQGLDEGVGFEVVSSESLSPATTRGAEPRLYVALGLAAAEALDRLEGDLPALEAYLTREQAAELGRRARRTAVLLDQPLARYLAFCKLLLDIDSLGILADAELRVDADDRQTLERLGLTLRQYRVDPDNKLLPTLRRLLQREDALLMLPSQALYNRDTLKGVLLTGYRSRKPVISYSPAHVRAGALATIYSSPQDIGRHLAQLVEQRLRDPRRQPPAIVEARYFTIATNPRVARSLGLGLPDRDWLRERLREVQ